MVENRISLSSFELGKKLVGMEVGMMAQGIDLGLEGTSAPLIRSTHGEKDIPDFPLFVTSIHNRLQLPVVDWNYSRAKLLIRKLIRGSC